MNENEQKKQWYTLDYVDALRLGYEQYKKKEASFLRTTVMIPQTMRIEIEQIGTRWNYSQRFIIFQLVYLGHAKLQHDNRDAIKKLQSQKSDMKHPKIGRIRDFLYDMRTVIDELSKPKQRTVLMTEPTSASLGAMGETLGVERASLIRLCMYYSLITLEDAASEIVLVAKREIQKAQKYITESQAIYEGFRYAESAMLKNEQGKQTEKGDYIKLVI